jgi:hypothetical protein
MRYFIFLFIFSNLTLAQSEQQPLETTTSRWKIHEQYITFIRDPMEHVTINESCHPVSKKECEVNKALSSYLKLEATEQVKSLFSQGPEIRPGKIVCNTLLQGEVVLGKKTIRGRFPKFEEFCQFSDGSLITIASLAFYQGPQIYPKDSIDKASTRPSDGTDQNQ